MIGIVEHGPDKVIQSCIQSGKYSGSGLLDHIDPGHKVSGFTHQKFSGFKDQGQLFSILLAKSLNLCRKVFPK